MRRRNEGGNEGNVCGKTHEAYVWKPQPRKHNVFFCVVVAAARINQGSL